VDSILVIHQIILICTRKAADIKLVIGKQKVIDCKITLYLFYRHKKTTLRWFLGSAKLKISINQVF